jgi:hypothetical protein
MSASRPEGSRLGDDRSAPRKTASRATRSQLIELGLGQAGERGNPAKESLAVLVGHYSVAAGGPRVDAVRWTRPDARAILHQLHRKSKDRTEELVRK